MANSEFEFLSSGGDDENNDKVAIAMAAADYHGQIVERYSEVLRSHVFPRDVDHLTLGTKKTRSYMRKLASEDAHSVLKVIWRESDYVPLQALMKLGKSKYFDGVPLTKNSLTSRICHELSVTGHDEQNAIKTDLGRVCEAAEAFGLIEFEATIGKRRPMRGTNLLHKVMVITHLRNAELMHSLSSPSAAPQSREVAL